MPVIFGTEHGIRRTAEPANRQPAPQFRIVVRLVAVIDKHHFHTRMNLPQPRGPQFPGNRVRCFFADDHHHLLRLLLRGVDEQLVPAMRRQKFSGADGAAKALHATTGDGRDFCHSRSPITHIASNTP